MDGLYVFNNPWSRAVDGEAHDLLRDDARSGMPDPRDVDGPAEGRTSRRPTCKPTLTRYAKLFDLGEVGETLGYPMFMKPYDGGGWRASRSVDDEAALRDGLRARAASA